jgi:hypothetical protein
MDHTPVGKAGIDTGTATDATHPANALAGPRPDAQPRTTTAQAPLCPACGGVIVGVDNSAYTPARGRLILTQGYCRGTCSAGEEPGGAPAEAAMTAVASTAPVTPA